MSQPVTVAAVRTHFTAIAISPELRVTRAICVAVVAIALIMLVAPHTIVTTLALTPGLVVSQYRVWTFVTSAVVHSTLVSAVTNLTVFATLSPPIERAMASLPFALLLLIVTAGSNLILFFNLLSFYAVTQYEWWIFMATAGLYAVNGALTMAAKQRFLDSPLLAAVTSHQSALSLVSFNALPGLYVALTFLCYLFHIVTFRALLLTVYGCFIAFVYLRFYARDADSGLTGDLRPEFSFASNFPEVFGVRGVVNLGATIPFHAMMRAGLFNDSIKAHQSNTSAATTASTVTDTAAARSFASLDPQAERRRLLAIKAIDEKLAQLANASIAAGAASQSGTGAALSLPDDTELEAMERALGTGSSEANGSPSNASDTQPLLGNDSHKPTSSDSLP